MKKTIFLAASMNFYKELIEVEQQLIALGFRVEIPISATEMKKTGNYNPDGYKNAKTYGERSAIIRANFDHIVHSDALLVINNVKNGVTGYIGPNVLMEIGLAFYYHKKIYIWNPVDPQARYVEELKCFDVQFIYQDLTQIAI